MKSNIFIQGIKHMIQFDRISFLFLIFANCNAIADNVRTGTYVLNKDCNVEILKINDNLIEFKINTGKDPLDSSLIYLHDTLRILTNKGKYVISEEDRNVWFIAFSFSNSKLTIFQDETGDKNNSKIHVCNGIYKLSNTKEPFFDDGTGKSTKFNLIH